MGFQLDDEEIDPLTGQPSAPPIPIQQSNPIVQDQPPMQAAPTPMDPTVKDYIAKKFNLGDYSDENRKKLLDNNSGYDLRGSIGAALIAAGGGNGLDALKQRENQRRQTVSDFDKGRTDKIQEYQLGRQLTKDEREDKEYGDDRDPTSAASKVAQQAALKMGYKGDVSKITAEQFKRFSPAMEKIFQVEQARLNHQDARTAHNDAKKTALDEKLTKLSTPYGTAITEKDADDLKKSGELKSAFDDQIDSLISLREKHKGGAFGPDSKIGKDLSAQAIQSYDALAKQIGMSRVGAANIRNLIPEDPLEFRGVGEQLTGRDTTLEALKHLKAQTDKSFKNTVAGRTRPGSPGQQMAGGKDKNEVVGQRTGTDQSTGQKVIQYTYADGTKKTVPADDAVAGR